VIDIDCTWLSRAWWRYLKGFLSPRPCSLIPLELLIFILIWNQHFRQCRKDEPSRCYNIFRSIIISLLPLYQEHPDITLLMVMHMHQESYLNFLGTLMFLNIPRKKLNIIYNPFPYLYELGAQKLEMARSQGFTSLYFSNPNPLLLEMQPYEEVTIIDSDNEEDTVPLYPSAPSCPPTPPCSSPPRETTTPSSSQNVC
jgi:hypothetical protein